MNYKQLIELVNNQHFTDCDEAKDYILSNKYAEPYSPEFNPFGSYYFTLDGVNLVLLKESNQVKLAKVIALSEVKRLREVTGRGMMDCKKALVKSDGDFDEAIKILEKMPKLLIHRVNE
jgi:hypothetical protein